MKTAILLLTALLITLVAMPAQASGFYLPPLAEAALFLLLTPAGWALLAVIVLVLVVLIVKATRR